MSVGKQVSVSRHSSGSVFGWGRAALVAAVALSGGFTTGACSSGFGGSSCEESRTCAPSGGSSSDGGDGGEANPQTAGSAANGGAGDDGAAGAGQIPVTCGAGLEACGGDCVELKSSAEHCGSCDVACEVGAICSASKCKPCPSKYLGCDGKCIDPATSLDFCGASARCTGEQRGAECGVGEVCGDGICLSNDATLAELSLTPAKLSPSFNPNKVTYTAAFPYLVPHLTLAATPSSADAVMSYADEAFTLDDRLSVEAPYAGTVGPVKIEVKAPTGKTQSYDVTLKRNPLVSTYVKPFNCRTGFRAGSSVAIDGNTAVFGAPSEDGSSPGVNGDDTATEDGSVDSGAAYVVVRAADGTWSRQAYLKAATPQKSDVFGSAIAISGDTIAVGVPGNDSHRGKVVVFVRNGSTWSQQAEVFQPTKIAGNNFGIRVALDGDLLVVSAEYASALLNRGPVSAFTRSGGTWTADSVAILPPQVNYSDQVGYGHRVALSGNRLAVSEVEGEHAVYLMQRDDSGWSLEATIKLNADGGLANADVALDGDTLAVATYDGVHVFGRVGSTWKKQTSLYSFDNAAEEGFGASIALKGDLLAVGSGCVACIGGVSTFVRNGSTWDNGAFVRDVFVKTNDALGTELSISQNRVVAGATGEDSGATQINENNGNAGAIDSGAVYILE